jgi:N-acetylneuraminic acid mutarotase
MAANRSGTDFMILASLLVCGLQLASAQSTSRVALARAGTNYAVSWTNRGTLQAAPAPQGPWRDVLEAPNPTLFAPSNAQQFFRAISRWSTRSNLLEANSEMSVAELDGRIYVMGGYPASRVTQRTVQVYDSVQNRWSLTTPLPIPLNHAMPATVNGRIYIIGGQTNSSGTAAFVDTVFEYNPVTTAWTARASMPTARSAGAAAVIGNLIYVAGGRTSTTGQDFAVYDTVSNQWTTLPPMPTGRNHLAAAVIDGRVYVAGGRLGAGFDSQMTAALEMYDPVARTWTARASLPAPRGGCNGIAVDGCFFVFGGEGPNGVFNAHEMYVASMNRWFRLEPIPTAVHGVTGSAFINGWIHLPGGGTAVGGSSGSTIHQVFWVGGICP